MRQQAVARMMTPVTLYSRQELLQVWDEHLHPNATYVFADYQMFKARLRASVLLACICWL